ncbi:MAG: YicC/YloC family endoribonuclease, partial [Wenzhouxiangella sp.]|nr:YicC/YloC family endoribonuclease [Wenzhouxiangella sp.]
LEPDIRERFKQALARGKVEVGLRFNAAPGAACAEMRLDEDLARALLRCHGELARLADDATGPDLGKLLQWPGMVIQEQPDADPERAAAMTLLDETIAALIEAREREGAAIAEMIETRLAAIEQQVAAVRGHLPAIRKALDDRFRERLDNLPQPVEPGRIEQEVVLALQKLDVDEELDRLDAHVAEIRRVIGRSEPVGRRLDFLMQELNREANTLGSKAAVAETGQAAVELKVLIEQMREQVQNVE